MNMPRLLSTLLASAAFTALAIAAPADPTITPAARLPRQADAAFIGWVFYNSTWTTQSCDAGGTWYQSGSYAQCCPDTAASCVAPTACVAGSQIYPLASTTITTACTGNYNNALYSICNTLLIFESFGDANPKTDIVCGESSKVWSFYRQIPASATEKPSAISSSSSASTSASASPSPQPQKHTSQAWIAGAVAGPIIAIALVAGILFFCMRRKKSKKAKLINQPNQGHQPNSLPQTGGAMMGPPPGVTTAYTKPQMTQNTSSVYYGQPSSEPPAGNPYQQQHQHQQQQQGFSQSSISSFPQSPASPAPQYSTPASSPPPPHDAKFGYNAPTHPGVSELGGLGGAAPPSTTGQAYTAELPGERPQR